jgi:hypothetical protein
MYLYGLWQEPKNAFDSALLRANGEEREGMRVARAEIGPRPGLPGPSTGGPAGGAATTSPVAAAPSADGTAQPSVSATPVLRIVGKRVTVDRRTRRANVTVRCVLAACRGRFTIRSGSWKEGRDVRLAANTTKTIRVRLTPRGLRALAARSGGTAKVKATKTRRAALCPAGGGACAIVPLVLR